MAFVFVAVAIRVADQRRLPVIMDEGVGDGDIVGGVGELLLLVYGFCVGFFCNGYIATYVNEPIVVVLVVVTVRGDVAVVDPDVVGFFYFVSTPSFPGVMAVLTNSKSIPIVSQDLFDAQVSDNHIRGFLDHTFFLYISIPPEQLAWPER